MNSLKFHKIITTADGTNTVYSTMFSEAAHSLHGASNETATYYVNGCHVIEKIKELSQIAILEVGLGAGVGVDVTLDKIKDLLIQNPHCKVTFYTLELQEELITFFTSSRPFFREEKIDYLPPFISKYHHNEITNFELYIVQGDARVTVPKLKEILNRPFDCIYQDAYSPRKNSFLWTSEWFTLLHELSHPQAILSTYSSTKCIRKSMIHANWALFEGGAYGPKKSSTRAMASGTTSSAILELLERSTTPMLTDANAKEYMSKQNDEVKTNTETED